ncbi:MAG: hypothetical protein QW275_03790, partial [Candidatus Anstonellaceae archaeon]
VEVSKQEIGQAIEIKAKQIVKQSQEAVAPYRNFSKSDSVLLSMLSEFDQRISDLDAKLRLKNYEQAAQLALSLPKLADGIKKHAESLKASKNTSQESQAALSAKLEELGSRIVALQSKAQEYRQAINLSNAVSLVQKANASILSGDIEYANSSLSFAEIDIRVHESILEKRILEIDAARSNLTILEAQLNLSLSKPSLIKPDIKQEQSIFAQAKEEVFDNPAAALEAAKKAVESANAKVKDAQTVSVAAAALLVMFSFIGALFIAFFLHIRGKKRGRL